MREILFRGKRKFNGEWAEGDLRQFNPYGLNYVNGESKRTFIIADERKNGGTEYEVIPDTVGQYTGLTDKNGTKIFEGDILKGKHDWVNWNTSFGNDEEVFLEQKIRGAYGKYIDRKASDIFGQRYHYFRNYAVEYYAPIGGWRVRNGSCFHGLTKNYIINRDLEVIGNIHDNPELLKGENRCEID